MLQHRRMDYGRNASIFKNSVQKVFSNNKPTNLSILLLKTMAMIFFMIFIFYMIPDIGTSFQTYEKNDITPRDWIDNWTLRAPETIMTESLQERISGDTSFDVSTGQDGSTTTLLRAIHSMTSLPR